MIQIDERPIYDRSRWLIAGYKLAIPELERTLTGPHAPLVIASVRDMAADLERACKEYEDFMGKIYAPFTPVQVEALNGWQHGPVHPFTCCSPEEIPECQRSAHTSDGMLTATEDGWVCPCGKYTQDWAHDYMGHNNKSL